MSEVPQSDMYSQRDHLFSSLQFQEECLKEIETSYSAQRGKVVSTIEDLRAFLRKDTEHKDPIADQIILRFPREEWDWRIRCIRELEKRLVGFVGKTIYVREREWVSSGDSDSIHQTNFWVGVLAQRKLVFNWGEDNGVYIPTEKHVYFTKMGLPNHREQPPTLIQGNIKLSLKEVEIGSVDDDSRYPRIIYQEQITKALELIGQ